MPVSRLLKGPRLAVRIGDSFTELLAVDYHQHQHNTQNKSMIAGVQVNVQSSVCAFGVQCSPTVREIGIQCSLSDPPASSLYLQTSSPIPSESSQEATDHDTSAYTLGDDESS